MYNLTNRIPDFTKAGAYFSKIKHVDLKEEFICVSRFGDTIRLYSDDGKHVILPRECLTSLGKDLRDEGRDIEFENKFIPLFEEQGTVVDQSVRLLRQDCSHIVSCPTGWGKTYAGCAIIANLRKKALIITTKQDIADQWIKAIRDVLALSDGEIGLWYGDSVPSPSNKIVVGLVQSLHKGPPRYPAECYEGYGLVVVDECHRIGADVFSQSMWNFPAKLRLGLSATPRRADGKGVVLKAHLGDVRVVGHQETLVPKVFMRSSGWSVPRGMWHKPDRMAHVYKKMSKHYGRNLEISKFVEVAYRKKRKTIVFSSYLEHLHHLEAMLLDVGIPSSDTGYYVGISTGKYGTGSESDKKARRDAVRYKPVILATYQMVSEGTDIPWLDCAVLGLPRSEVEQIVGRIRRFHPGKPQPVVLDLVDGGSSILKKFAAKRLRWYESVGCDILDFFS